MQIQILQATLTMRHFGLIVRQIRNVQIGNLILFAHQQVIVIMNSVVIGENVKIKNAIIDKEVNIPSNTTIGYDLKADRKRFDVTASGIVIVAKKEAIN